jgi:CheY-like chemotaxis protein
MSDTVLVIEDEVDLAATLEYNLRAEGLQTRVAHTGGAGLEAAAAEPAPDVVILDLMLPDLPGTEVCRRLRASERTRGIPIIMCTAKGERDRPRGGLRGGRRRLRHQAVLGARADCCGCKAMLRRSPAAPSPTRPRRSSSAACGST